MTGFPFAKIQPLRCVEEICVFYKRPPTYNPQGLLKLDTPKVSKRNNNQTEMVYKKDSLYSKDYVTYYTNYPRQTLNFPCQRDGLHPTQKPVALFEYLIKTYTNEGEIVLDNCMGSGTTAVACINTNRKYIGMEMNTTYYERVIKRIGAPLNK